jgi:hypothetical protein
MTIVIPRSFNELPFIPETTDFPHHIALVIDDVVQDVLHLFNESYENIKNSTEIVQVDTVENGGPFKNWLYNSELKTFSSTEESDTNDFSVLPYRIAFISDAVAKEIISVDERLASILLSNPDFIDVDETIKPGYYYNSDKTGFIK